MAITVLSLLPCSSFSAIRSAVVEWDGLLVRQ